MLIRPRTRSHIVEEQQQGTATRDVCGISPAWSPPRSGNKRCQFAGTLTGATGLEPASSGVTGVPKRFQRVAPSHRSARSCGFRQVPKAGVLRLVAPGRFHPVSRRDRRLRAPAVARRSLYPTLQAKEPKPLRTPAGSGEVRLSGAWFPLRFHRDDRRSGARAVVQKGLRPIAVGTSHRG
jgi:hypothetical protein